MRKICFYIGTGYTGVEYKEHVEFPDEYTDEDIQDEYEMWVNEKIDKQWWEE